MRTLDNDYLRGYIDGLRSYAWMRDGVLYVGTTGRTLREAVVHTLIDNGWTRADAEAWYS